MFRCCVINVYIWRFRFSQFHSWTIYSSQIEYIWRYFRKGNWIGFLVSDIIKLHEEQINLLEADNLIYETRVGHLREELGVSKVSYGGLKEGLTHSSGMFLRNSSRSNKIGARQSKVAQGSHMWEIASDNVVIPLRRTFWTINLFVTKQL